MSTQVSFSTTRVEINPPLGTSLAGYFTDRKAVGILDNLYASVLVLEKNGAKVVLIACDLIGWPDDLVRPLRETVAKRLGIDPCAVMITATHTHTGPVMRRDLTDRAYQGVLVGKIVAAAVEANDRLAPGALEYGAGVDDRFAFNRRYFMKNGSVLTNPGANNPDVIGPAGTADHSLQVIKVVDAHQHIRALVVNYANHPDTTDGNLISADWPGALRATVQGKIGADVPMLVLNGAAGDVNHFDVLNHHVMKSPAEAQMIGAGYGNTVLEILGHTQPLSVNVIDAACESLPVPYRRITAAELAAARHTVAELAVDPEAVMHGQLEAQDIARGNKAVRLMFARDIVEAESELKGKTQPLEITVIKLGPLGLVGINGEVFSEIGTAIKQNSLFEHTLVVELANGSIGYLGNKKVYQQGGYETMWGKRVCDEIEDYILGSVSKLMKQLVY